MTHDLKTWPEMFDAVWRGDKTAELRAFDRPFRVGDDLVLRCYHPDTGFYDGRAIVARITHLLHASEHLAPGHGMISFAIRQKIDFDSVPPISTS